MKQGIINDASGLLLPEVSLTTSPWDRMRGLLGRSEPNSQQGFLIKPCNMVHTAFMRYPIDVIFMDKLGRILAIHEKLSPWKIAICLKAKMVLELRSGSVKNLKLGLSEQLLWEPIN
jgi:uncharacterized membrane protein (UPF0127 family)